MLYFDFYPHIVETYINIMVLASVSSEAHGMSICWSVCPTFSFRLTFPTEIDVHQRMNPHDFGDPLTLALAPQAGQTCHLSCEIS